MILRHLDQFYPTGTQWKGNKHENLVAVHKLLKRKWDDGGERVNMRVLPPAKCEAAHWRETSPRIAASFRQKSKQLWDPTEDTQIDLFAKRSVNKYGEIAIWAQRSI